ncbi:MAG: hypothetical protein ACK5II_14565 [Paracoccus sp. (in: a-proteobacteria)]
MAQSIDWVLINDNDDVRLGAIGFLEDMVAVVALFDANADRASLIGAARSRPEVFIRDPGIAQLLAREASQFALPQPLDAVWSDYFRPGVEMAARGGRTCQVHRHGIVRIMVRRGMGDDLLQAVMAV